MTAIVGRRLFSARAPLTVGVGLGATVAGAVTAAQPKLALGLVAAAVLAFVALRHQVAALGLLLFLTCIVPYGVQNRLGVGGGEQAPGLLLSDLLLISGIGGALLTLARERLDRRRAVFAALLVLFLAAALGQFVHGLAAGGERSRAGQELRVLLGFGSFLIVMPLLADVDRRRRVLGTLLGLSIALGAWGLIQWFGHLSLGAAGDVGVRAGVRLTSSGSGQLQGGEYGFPVVVIMGTAILIFGALKATAWRFLVMLAIALNAVACLVTFERSFWLDAVLGVCFVFLCAPLLQRVKVLFVAPIVVVLAIVSMSVLAPAELTTAHERLTSISDYSSDNSVRYRITESRFVLERIHAEPLAGSGLAATIFWGRPWAQQPPKPYGFAHNGYLWLAWKIGIPAASLLVLLMALGVVLRPPPGEALATRAVRRGAPGSDHRLASGDDHVPQLQRSEHHAGVRRAAGARRMSWGNCASSGAERTPRPRFLSPRRAAGPVSGASSVGSQRNQLLALNCSLTFPM